MDELKSNKTRGYTAIVLLIIAVIGELAASFAKYLQFNVLKNISEGVKVTYEYANSIDQVVLAISIISVCIALIAIFSFIFWFSRVYHNLHKKVQGMKYSPGMAAGWWFVPLMNFYKPMELMKEASEKTKKLLSYNSISFNEMLSGKLITVWWLLHIGAIMISQITSRYFDPEGSLEVLIGSTIMCICNNFISIAFYCLSIKIIRDYSVYENVMMSQELNELVIDNQAEEDNHIKSSPDGNINE